MGVPVINPNPMTVEEFYAFTDTRPDNEKWELIDGEPVLNATASELHQAIIKNLFRVLSIRELEQGSAWLVFTDFGVRISETERPEPDILIRPNTGPLDPNRRDRDDIIVAIEVLSPSTAARDLRWKRNAYVTLPSLTHYVVVAQDAMEVVIYAKEKGFAEQRLTSRDAVLQLPSLGVSLPLIEIYRGTGLG